MICCLLAALLVGGSARFRRTVPVLQDAGILLLGVGLGALLVEALAAFSSDLQWLHHGRHPLGVIAVVVTGAALSVVGLRLGERPSGTRRATVLALAGCGGAILTEILDLHVARLHVSPAAPATILVHAPSVVFALLAAGLMIRGTRSRGEGDIATGHPGPSRPDVRQRWSADSDVHGPGKGAPLVTSRGRDLPHTGT